MLKVWRPTGWLDVADWPDELVHEEGGIDQQDDLFRRCVGECERIGRPLTQAEVRIEKDRNREMNYQSRYSDFREEAAAELVAAHHMRVIVTPAGRKLYMAGSKENDLAEIAEIREIVARCNAPAKAEG
jgi:hypothetical protein